MFDDDQLDVLRADGVNVLLPGKGLQGARTLSTGEAWRHVRSARTVLNIERALDQGLGWAVFEPNTETLWATVRARVEEFLHVQWQHGVLVGSRPEEAFFVRCDATTMTEEDVANDRVVVVVGLAVMVDEPAVVLTLVTGSGGMHAGRDDRHATG